MTMVEANILSWKTSFSFHREQCTCNNYNA